jgi:hypothetical protein
MILARALSLTRPIWRIWPGFTFLMERICMLFDGIEVGVLGAWVPRGGLGS